MKKFNPEEYKKMCDASIMSYTMGYLILKNAYKRPIKRLVIIICTLFICMVSFSQEFSKINYLDSTKTQVSNLAKDQFWCKCSDKWEGESCDLYIGYDFQTIVFVFNSEDKCKKIIVRNPVGKPIHFNDNIIFTGVLDGRGKIIYTIEK